MTRSVVAELDYLPEGIYSTVVKVTAYHHTDLLSVEDLVEFECRKRRDNEKFSQVRRSYNLVHTKGAAHMKE
jgi:hypothetical protein